MARACSCIAPLLLRAVEQSHRQRALGRVRAAPSHRIEVLWSQHHHLDLPGVVKFLGQCLATLKAQGLMPRCGVDRRRRQWPGGLSAAPAPDPWTDCSAASTAAR